MKIVLDGEDAIAGRLGSYAAKELLKGNEVIIINAEKAIISGNKREVVEKIRRRRKKGGSSQKGPKISRLPDRLLKRMVRGMLPWDKSKGKAAYKRLKCYAGNNLKENFKDIKKLNYKKPVKFITIKQISELI